MEKQRVVEDEKLKAKSALDLTSPRTVVDTHTFADPEGIREEGAFPHVADQDVSVESVEHRITLISYTLLAAHKDPGVIVITPILSLRLIHSKAFIFLYTTHQNSLPNLFHLSNPESPHSDTAKECNKARISVLRRQSDLVGSIVSDAREQLSTVAEGGDYPSLLEGLAVQVVLAPNTIHPCLL